MNEDLIACAVILVAVAFTACFWIGLDKRQERIMAERGYCYQSVDRPGNSPSWQYQKCK